jgi:hypothetical protein
LTADLFDLDPNEPTVTLPARFNKSRKTKEQPLPADVADLLRAYLEGKPAGLPIWPGTWDKVAAEMLHGDLTAAGIPYAVEGPDGPLYADFHALRHTYLTLGGRAGIDLRTLQELAGHSSPAITQRYTHVRRHDLAGAVEKLPSFLPMETAADAAVLQATGTEGVIADTPGRKIPYTILTQTGDSKGLRLTTPDKEDGDSPPPIHRRNPLSSNTFDNDQSRLATDDSAPAHRQFSTRNTPSRCLIRSGSVSSRSR